MATEGKSKIDRKSSKMTENYNAAKPSMKKHYGEQPFGPLTTKHFNDSIDDAVHKTDSDLWRENWIRSMQR